MKTLLITTLTSALLSFNSFADTTNDIKNIANTMAKDGIQQMNTQLNTSLRSDIKSSFNIVNMKANSATPVLLAKVANENSRQEKNTVQAADE